MKRDDILLASAMIAAVAAVIGLFLDRRNAQMIAGGSPMSVTTNGPQFTFASRSPGADGVRVPNRAVTGSCGCGGSLGDYAVAALNPIFGDAIQLIPGMKMPLPMGGPGIKLLPN